MSKRVEMEIFESQTKNNLTDLHKELAIFMKCFIFTFVTFGSVVIIGCVLITIFNILNMRANFGVSIQQVRW